MTLKQVADTQMNTSIHEPPTITVLPTDWARQGRLLPLLRLTFANDAFDRERLFRRVSNTGAVMGRSEQSGAGNSERANTLRPPYCQA